MWLLHVTKKTPIFYVSERFQWNLFKGHARLSPLQGKRYKIHDQVLNGAEPKSSIKRASARYNYLRVILESIDLDSNSSSLEDDSDGDDEGDE